MFRASAALLLAFSEAARHNLNAGHPNAVSNVIERVGSLLQSKSQAKVLERLHALADITPGAIDSLNAQLESVVSQIEQDVETKIKSGFLDTQNYITSSITALTNATDTAVDRKAAADLADNTWFDCVSMEKAKREAIEAAEVALEVAENSTVAPCQLQVDRSPFAYDPTVGADWGFACDNEAGTCDENLQNYNSTIQGMLSTLKSDISTAAAAWSEAKQACDAANADVVAKQDALATANTEWTSQRNTCLVDHENRQVAMCLFGTLLQTKCEKAAAYEALIAEVERVQGSDKSEPDRKEEWQTVSITKCILTTIAAGNDLDLAACEARVNYDVDVGVLDKQAAAFADQTTADRFTCAETAITFRGETWVVPSDAAPPSSSYYTEAFTPAVDLTLGASPFSFCSTEAPGKR